MMPPRLHLHLITTEPDLLASTSPLASIRHQKPEGIRKLTVRDLRSDLKLALSRGRLVADVVQIVLELEGKCG